MASQDGKGTDFKSLVAEIKLAHDIVDYIELSGVPLKNSGSSWKGLCPFHKENSPSFTVNEQMQSYRCFGCGTYGDIIAYVMETENLEFMEALRVLGDEKGIKVEFSGEDVTVDYASLKRCIKDAANFYLHRFRELPDDHIAVRAITDRDLPRKGNMKYGYAPEGRTTMYDHLSGMGYSDETILGTGVCRYSEKTKGIFDFWRGRLMFFITDSSGKPVGFSGRKLHDDDKMGKYVNSPDGPLFDKSSVLFNFSVARKPAGAENKLFIVEGQFDVSAFMESSIPNVAATSGTAFTSKHGNIALRAVGSEGKIIFCFDGDDAGKKAAGNVFKNVPFIQSNSFVVNFPDKMDPCDYRMEHGEDGLREYVEDNAIHMVKFMINMAREGLDLMDPQEKFVFLDRAAAILASVTNTNLRETYARQVSTAAFIPLDAVRKGIEEAKPLTNDNDASVKRPRPMDDDETDDNEEVTTHYRYEIAEGSPEKNVLAKMSTQNKLYSAAARALHLAVLSRDNETMVDHLSTHVESFPKPLRHLVSEMSGTLKGSSPMVPELFTMPLVAEKVLDPALLPLSSLMSKKDMEELFTYLVGYLEAEKQKALKRKRVSESRSFISGADFNDIEALAKAITKEKSYEEQS